MNPFPFEELICVYLLFDSSIIRRCSVRCLTPSTDLSRRKIHTTFGRSGHSEIDFDFGRRVCIVLGPKYFTTRCGCGATSSKTERVALPSKSRSSCWLRGEPGMVSAEVVTGRTVLLHLLSGMLSTVDKAGR